MVKKLILDRGFMDGERISHCKRDRGIDVQMCPIKGFTSWTAATVPIHVLLLREQDSDGQQHEWALLTTEDFADGRRLPQDYQWRTQIEERHRQLQCFHDLTDLHSRCFHAITAQVVMILLSDSVRQYQWWKLLPTLLASCAPDQIRFRLAIRRESIVIYHNHAYTQMPLLSLSRELLPLEPQTRARAMEKVERLEQSMLCPFENLRPP